jgi:hypothetical protein
VRHAWRPDYRCAIARRVASFYVLILLVSDAYDELTGDYSKLAFYQSNSREYITSKCGFDLFLSNRMFFFVDTVEMEALTTISNTMSAG